MPPENRSPLQESNVDEIAAAHEVLRQHYGQPVLPIHEVCHGIQAWLSAIRDEHMDSDDHALHEIATAFDKVRFIGITAAKSNLLYRLLFLRQPLRTKKCPEHKGHWSGYAFPGDECPHGCCVGYDITGWLP